MKQNETNSIILENYMLKPGYIFLPTKPTLISTVLGSSVSITLCDVKQKIGGMNHFQYPSTNTKHEATAKYGNVAIATLISMMVQNGSKLKHMRAQIFGGAYISELSTKDIGKENVRMAKKCLQVKRIKIITEDIGGQLGRKIIFNTQNNEAAVIKVKKLRKIDWYPYENDR